MEKSEEIKPHIRIQGGWSERDGQTDKGQKPLCLI